MKNHLEIIFFTTIVGTIARLIMLRLDYRQYPTYPHGAITHLSLGFIAAALGSVAIPALIEQEYTAVTFLALAAQQFREIRNMERETLSKLEPSELVPRGDEFIEGIARAFEARSYLVILIAIFTSAATWLLNLRFGLFWAILGGLAFSVILLFVAIRYMEGKRISDIADVDEGKIHFKEANLFVDDIQIMNLGMEEAKNIILEKGLAVVIRPKDKDGVPILANVGQRQAIAHIAATLLGIHKETDSAEFTPLVRRNLETGAVALILVPTHGVMEDLIDAVERTPVLESAIAKPSRAGIYHNRGKRK
ncbi:YIEGIA family protein [Anaerobranca gottschalkii]|uniref:YIEGIA protein n=1 Tax=Anaerobranca gottschalkii DSM 13577 TaxID=1120990 RepID=A0A1H9YE39_9FIRM|nr:YIEGIA family protein [Anaerobranca gottschalkii]SES67167.1 hypothetical protein SAMN03080614_1002147 [Anaerobranca gottschalkii DSM 13577]